MILVRIIRFLKGYVIFTCKGGFPERFINLCSLYGINLWDARSADGIITAKTDIKSYKKIRPCVRKSGMSAKITQKCGLPFFISPYIKRKGIFAGIIISAVLMFVLTSCIWTVEVTGNEKFTTEQMLEIAENYGIFAGSFKKNIDVKDLKTRPGKEIDGIIWFSANINGSHASLEMLEGEGEDNIIDLDSPCNIVSGVDGEILSLEAHYGTPVIKAGNAVTKGDLLISGVMEKTDGSAYFVHARGSAVIRTNKSLSCDIPFSLTAKKISQVRNTRTLTLFGVKIPLGRKHDADFSYRRTFMLSYEGRILPAGTFSDMYISFETAKIDLTVNRAELLACNRLFSAERNVMVSSETEKKTLTVTSHDGGVNISANYINHETTGIEKYLQVSTDE